ncbi:MAG: hypothetical protein GY801_28380 [bacterium]|nr:hypothetical protein [bacterium]
MKSQESQSPVSGSKAPEFPKAGAEGGTGSELQDLIEAYEKKLLLDALHKNLGYRANTAAMLGIDRKTLYTKLKKYGIV